MSDKDALTYERYLPWKGWVEAGFWIAVTAANCIANSLTTLMELRRGESGIQAWEPMVWEMSSALVWLLVLIPAIVWRRPEERAA